MIHFCPDHLPFAVGENIVIKHRGRSLETSLRTAHVYMTNRAGVGSLAKELKLKMGDTLVLTEKTKGVFKASARRDNCSLNVAIVHGFKRYIRSRSETA